MLSPGVLTPPGVSVLRPCQTALPRCFLTRLCCVFDTMAAVSPRINPAACRRMEDRKEHNPERQKKKEPLVNSPGHERTHHEQRRKSRLGGEPALSWGCLPRRGDCYKTGKVFHSFVKTIRPRPSLRW